MILIFSQNIEESTNDVYDYLTNLSNERVLKLNTEDFLLGDLRIVIGQDFFFLGKEKIHFDEIKVVWFRRWFDYSFLNEAISGLRATDKTLANQLFKFTISEAKVLFTFFFEMLENAFWLSRPTDNDINKLVVLHNAQKIGLEIPKSYILTRKTEIPNTPLITKTLGDAGSYSFKENEFTFYTEKTRGDKISDSFFPSLFQQQLEKEYEIRTFFLKDRTFSIAIFSQRNSKTAVDYRHYDTRVPNYYTKLSLPHDLDNKLIKLMNRLDLSTGSIDLIKATDGKYYFLEVNPIGQFGFVSHHGNYNIEKHIAQLLINEHKTKRLQPSE